MKDHRYTFGSGIYAENMYDVRNVVISPGMVMQEANTRRNLGAHPQFNFSFLSFSHSAQCKRALSDCSITAKQNLTISIAALSSGVFMPVFGQILQ